jgi:chorismate mutase
VSTRVRDVQAVRGAVQVEHDDPTRVVAAARELLTEIIDRNALAPDDVISILFTTTPDLTSAFPAQAARELGLVDVPLMCASEIAVPGSLPRVIRALAHTHTTLTRAEIRHVYLRGAQRLRPDLFTP